MKSKRIILAVGLALPLSLLTAPTGPLAYAPPPTGRLAGQIQDGALAAALASVSPTHIEADLRFLADDLLEGRDTPSRGLEIAALYIESRLRRLGFAHGGPDGFRYSYPLIHRKVDMQRSGLTASQGSSELRLKFGRDYFLERIDHFVEWQVKAAVVSVGSGRSSDFAAADLRGNWALLFDAGRAKRQASRAALRAGAVGLILVRDGDKDRPYAERLKRTTRYLIEGRANFLGPGREPKRPNLPVVYVDRDAAARLFAFAGVSTDAGIVPTGTRLPFELEEVRAAKNPIARVANLCGFWPGSDPVLAKEVLIVSAHYDHVGTGPDAETGEVLIFNGADDNGSGSSGLLAIAEALKSYGPLKRSVLLLWLSGEEKGLWGSTYWTRDPWLPTGCRPVADINIDMIGRTQPNELYITPSDQHEYYNTLARSAYELCDQEGFPDLASQDADWLRSDHMNFSLNLDLPVCFLSAGEHPDYHKPTDTAEKIDYDKIARVVRLVMRVLDDVQDRPLVINPDAAEAAQPATGADPDERDDK